MQVHWFVSHKLVMTTSSGSSATTLVDGVVQQSNVAQKKVTSSAASSAASTSGESDAYNLVWFGPHKLMSRFDLYHSTRDEHKRYVRSILECNVIHPGGQLDMLKRYIERTMKREQKEDESL